MKWLAGWDFPARTAPALPTLFAQFVFALLCSIAMIVLRMAIDLVTPSAGPLALIYPAVMIATLFGRWVAGALTLIATFAFTVYFVLPPVGSFELSNSADFPRLVVNASVLVVTVLLLEIFRSAVAHANAERDQQIAQRDLLLRELDHRVKNNFASVGSLLQMQAQRAKDPLVRDELNAALNRVEGIATAHRFLYRGGLASQIDMAAYLGELCGALQSALLRSERIGLRCLVDPVMVDRDRAISIGLIINELVTNAARHAFPGDRPGTVTVTFRRTDRALELVVEDDGCGMPAQPREGSLGRRLIEAFVHEAKGKLSTETSPAGTRCTVWMG